MSKNNNAQQRFKFAQEVTTAPANFFLLPKRKAMCYEWGDKRKIETGAVGDTKMYISEDLFHRRNIFSYFVLISDQGFQPRPTCYLLDHDSFSNNYSTDICNRDFQNPLSRIRKKRCHKYIISEKGYFAGDKIVIYK